MCLYTSSKHQNATLVTWNRVFTIVNHFNTVTSNAILEGSCPSRQQTVRQLIRVWNRAHVSESVEELQLFSVYWFMTVVSSTSLVSFESEKAHIVVLTMVAGFHVVVGAIFGCQLFPPVNFFSPGWLQWMSLKRKRRNNYHQIAKLEEIYESELRWAANVHTSLLFRFQYRDLEE